MMRVRGFPAIDLQGKPVRCWGAADLTRKSGSLMQQLAQHRAQIKKCRPGPAQEAAKRRALQVPGDKPFTLFALTGLQQLAQQMTRGADFPTTCCLCA